MANILQGHFNEDHIWSLTNGVSVFEHRSFDIWAMAFNYFKSYYPHISTLEDIDSMNENAPKEASNLDNPCPRIRALIGAHPYDCSNHGEHTYLNGLNVSILDTKAAASMRMHQANACPTPSYDFLPSDHIRAAGRKRAPAAQA